MAFGGKEISICGRRRLAVMCVPGVSCGELELRLDKDDGGGWLLVYAARTFAGSGRLTAHHAETLGSPEGGRSAAAIGTRIIITRPIQMYIHCTASPRFISPFLLIHILLPYFWPPAACSFLFPISSFFSIVGLHSFQGPRLFY